MAEYRQLEFPAHVVSKESAAALKAAIDVMLTSYSHTAKDVKMALSEAAQRTDISSNSRAVLGLLGSAVRELIAPLERQEEWARWAAPELHNDIESVDYIAVQRWVSQGGLRPF
jgi:hypothetical protein